MLRSGKRLARLIAAMVTLVFITSGSAYSKPATAPSIEFSIDGVTANLKKQVLAHIIDSRPDDHDDLQAYLPDLKIKILNSLQAVGFYHPAVEINTDRRNSIALVSITIETGEPVRVGELDVNLSGPATTNSEFMEQISQLPLESGDIFNHQKYQQIKDILTGNARSLGYFTANFTRAQVLVTKQERKADIHLHFFSGDRYSIGDVNYQSTLFPASFLKRWQPFEGIIPYRASYISKFTKNLQDSGYFDYVRVTPQLEKSVGNLVPLLVELDASSENVISVGAGYATDSGPRLKGNWLRPHTNRLGHSLEASTSVSRLRQQFSTSYRVPHKKNPETGNYSIDFGALNHRTDDTFSQLRTFDLGDHRQIKNGWYRDIFLRWENERFQIGPEKNQIRLLLPGISFSRTVSTGGLYPKKGGFLSFKLLAGHRTLLSDIDLVRATVSAKDLRSWRNKHYLITRAELGGLYSNRDEAVPASHRFFAGGDASVRGFAYQSISPVNTNNERVGGRFLTTASVEYNYTIREQWALAAFIDSGRAFTSKSAPYRTGIGFGIRWLSPVGPLRFDVASGISEDDFPIRLHLSIGPQL